MGGIGDGSDDGEGDEKGDRDRMNGSFKCVEFCLHNILRSNTTANNLFLCLIYFGRYPHTATEVRFTSFFASQTSNDPTTAFSNEPLR